MSQLDISEKRVSKGDLTPHIVLCQGTDSKGAPLGIRGNCLVIDCKARTQNLTAAAWQKHYLRSHNIKINEFGDLETLRRQLQPWRSPDFEMNADWGYYLTKKSPIQEFDNLKTYWQATSNPLEFRRIHHDNMLEEFRDEFTCVFRATPISFHAHASDAWPVLPYIAAALEDNAPAYGRKLTPEQEKFHRIATFESQMVSYHRALVWIQEILRRQYMLISLGTWRYGSHDRAKEHCDWRNYYNSYPSGGGQVRTFA